MLLAVSVLPVYCGLAGHEFQGSRRGRRGAGSQAAPPAFELKRHFLPHFVITE